MQVRRRAGRAPCGARACAYSVARAGVHPAPPRSPRAPPSAGLYSMRAAAPTLTTLLFLHAGRAQAAAGNNCSLSCECDAASGCGQPLSTVVPNVMLLSDSIGANGSGYFTNVKALLGANGDPVTGAGAVANAVVHHTGSYGAKLCGTSFGSAACISTWFGGNKYNVIHFNWGLHDICAKMYAPITPAEYAANMEQMYLEMKTHLAPHGTLIWSTTTPVPPSYKNRKNSDVLRINGQMVRQPGLSLFPCRFSVAAQLCVSLPALPCLPFDYCTAVAF
eukprot:SAG22_NODE_309_length_12657_cov_34.643733_4_plen_277_part_00